MNNLRALARTTKLIVNPLIELLNTILNQQDIKKHRVGSVLMRIRYLMNTSTNTMPQVEKRFGKIATEFEKLKNNIVLANKRMQNRIESVEKDMKSQGEEILKNKNGIGTWFRLAKQEVAETNFEVYSKVKQELEDQEKRKNLLSTWYEAVNNISDTFGKSNYNSMKSAMKEAKIIEVTNIKEKFFKLQEHASNFLY